MEKRQVAKLSAKPLMTQPRKVAAVSNHYSVKADSIAFNEYHIRFVRAEDVDVLRAQPEFADEEAVGEGAREKTWEVARANRGAMRAKLGFHAISGETLYNFREAGSETQLLFTQHRELALVLKIVRRGVGLDQLVPNQNCRLPVLKCLNACAKELMVGNRMLEIGRKRLFFDNSPSPLTLGGVEVLLYRGYKATYEVYAGGLKFLINPLTRVVRNVNKWEEYQQELAKHGSEELAIERCFVGQKVMKTYGDQRTLVLDGVARDMGVLSPFPNQKFACYEDYFSKTYNKKIGYRKQFLVYSFAIDHSRRDGDAPAQRKDYFVPELLVGVGLTDSMVSDHGVMRAFAEHTQLTPAQRFSLADGLRAKLNTSALKSEVKVALQEPSPLDALLLQPPAIVGGKKQVALSKWKMLVGALPQNVVLDNWVMAFDVQRNGGPKDDVDIVVDNLVQAAERHEVRLAQPAEYMLLPRNFVPGQLLDNLKKSKCKSPSFVFFFLRPRTAAEKYKHIKAAFNQAGIVTQVFKSYRQDRDSNNPMKFSKLLLQVAAKKGAKLWQIDTGLQDTLILGADVCHASRKGSVVAVTAQWGSDFNTHRSECEIQKRGQEVMRGVARLVDKLVAEYHKATKKAPKNVIFYRDGVGEGQKAEVETVEVNAIKAALAARFPGAVPSLTFVVVTKRVDDRFAVRDSMSNPEPGTVVNQQVVKPDINHFFLVSQQTNQGTVTPTSYEFICDEVGLDRTAFYNLTFHLCFNYFNWPGPVKVPAPVQYAHKLCGLVAVTLDPNISDALKAAPTYL